MINCKIKDLKRIDKEFDMLEAQIDALLTSIDAAETTDRHLLYTAKKIELNYANFKRHQDFIHQLVIQESNRRRKILIRFTIGLVIQSLILSIFQLTFDIPFSISFIIGMVMGVINTKIYINKINKYN